MTASSETSNQKTLLAGAVLAGASYLVSGHLPIPVEVGVLWKGSGVTLLAVYAALRARNLDGWLICAVMAFGALGDMLLEVAGLTTGAVAFLIGHLVAIALYWRWREPKPGLGRILLAAALVPAVTVSAYLLPADRGGAKGVAFYALFLSLMAASAWLSQFPRRLVGAGALMFAVSDLLIFARTGPLSGQPWVSPAVWVLYFGGQALICVGVTQRLSRGESRR